MELQLPVNVLTVAHYFTLEVSPTDFELRFSPLPALKLSNRVSFRISERWRDLAV